MSALEWPRQAQLGFCYDHRTTISAALASVLATTAGYPLDSIKARLQVKRYSSVLDCVQKIYAQEAVRTTSFTIYTYTKDCLHSAGWCTSQSILSKAASGGAGGAASGILISAGSCAFELIKVRAQLESVIAAKQGRGFKQITTWQGAREIVKQYGPRGLYFGFGLHTARDTLGTGLYFAMYDSLRFAVDRYQASESKYAEVSVPKSVVPFLCGSSCGLASWLILYPIDIVKTRVQRDALAGLPRRSAVSVFKHLITGPAGFRRLYSGLGVSAVRSLLQHGILWGTLENIRGWIEIRAGRQGSSDVSTHAM